jgi:hypothetical protein
LPFFLFITYLERNAINERTSYKKMDAFGTLKNIIYQKRKSVEAFLRKTQSTMKISSLLTPREKMLLC